MNRPICLVVCALVALQLACEREQPDELGASGPASATTGAAQVGGGSVGAHQLGAGAGESRGHAAALSPSTPPVAGEPHAGEAADPSTPVSVRTEPSWILPEGWVELENSSTMRMATWALPTDSGDAECAVFRFPGGGDPRANLRRWIGQVVNDAGEPSTDVAEQGQLVVDDTPVFVVKTTGTYVTQDPPMRGPEVRLDDYALFGAVFVLQEPVFVKCVGPRAEMQASETNTIDFVRSFTCAAPAE